MQLAMKRLQREFHQILSVNRQYLDAESVSRSSATRSSYSDFEEDESEDEFRAADQSVSEMDRALTIAMTDLKAIADCMTSSGYGKECVRIYKLQRKSIIDETLHHLGVERLTLAQVQKMDWEVQELKIRNWLNAVQVAVKTLFYGERILCDHVFSSSVSIKESCFHETSREGAKNLFGFPELVAKCKKSPEKMFRILDLYEAISNLWPEIEYIFSYESSLVVRSQAVSSLNMLGEAVNTILADFETAIQKESSKTPVPGGAIHPLTRYVMNYISFLADYSNVLSNIVADRTRILESPLPESYHGSPESYEDAFSALLAWFILVLLCKLDGKADLHKDVALSYLFFANNLQYVLVKVRTSNLKLLLGDDWVTKHESKVKKLASNFERMGWSKVYASLPENPAAMISPEQARDCFKKFNTSFDEAYRKQSTWVVPDQKLRDEIKVSVAKKLVPAYKELYDKFSAGLRREFGSETLIRYAPEDLGNYLSDLFFGAEVRGVYRHLIRVVGIAIEIWAVIIISHCRFQAPVLCDKRNT
ncbi:Exocyst complex component EXO70A1 [Morella rubra]|uniref:Exocyst subunit Exo70 family protein n=1 Tax=Morella rubra TaxID=262757 RepID=A0A6A1WND0_9ROSI|nr:Exocyst complex component EXO70A1 [Morella rubra]